MPPGKSKPAQNLVGECVQIFQRGGQEHLFWSSAAQGAASGFITLTAMSDARRSSPRCWTTIQPQPTLKSSTVRYHSPWGVFAKQLQSVFEASAGFASSLPHDLIYACLNVGTNQPPSLPPLLVPNYDLPASEIFHAYTAFLIENTGDLRIIHAGAGPAIPGVPTWVPDFSRRKDIATRFRETRNGMLHAGEFHFENFADDACTIASVTISLDKRRLTVDGQALGRCLRVVESSSMEFPRSLGETILRFRSEILEIARFYEVPLG